MKSWVMWIWRRSCEDIGGAKVWSMFVKVGRAFERSSSPVELCQIEIVRQAKTNHVVP